MLQQKEPQDYVIATGVSHSVRDLLQLAFEHVGLDYKDYVVIDPKLFRVAEVDHLVGDSTKAQEELGWEPEVSFEKMIQIMVDVDLDRLKKQVLKI